MTKQLCVALLLFACGSTRSLLSSEPSTDAGLPTAKVVKLLTSKSELERLRGLELAKANPTAAYRRTVTEMATNDPSHACRQEAIRLLATVGNETSVETLKQIGLTQGCICEKIAFQTLMQLARKTYDQQEPASIKAARQIQAKCANETLKEEMGQAIEKWERQQR